MASPARRLLAVVAAYAFLVAELHGQQTTLPPSSQQQERQPQPHAHHREKHNPRFPAASAPDRVHGVALPFFDQHAKEHAYGNAIEEAWISRGGTRTTHNARAL
jgi:hypothetical protein